MKDMFLLVLDEGISSAYRLDVKGDEWVNEGKHLKKIAREQRRRLMKLKSKYLIELEAKRVVKHE